MFSVSMIKQFCNYTMRGYYVIDDNWSSHNVLVHVAQQLLYKAGNNTELVTLDTQSQFSAMGAGDAHIQME